MFTCVYLDTLPPVPDRFIDQALKQRDRLWEESKSWDFSDSNRGIGSLETCYEGNLGITRRIKRGESLGPDWDQWIRENISPQVDASRVQVSVPKAGTDSTMHDAHTDNPEGWALLYVLDLGGDDVWTKFWRQRGHPLLRYGCAPNHYIGCGNFDDMILLDSVKLPERRWCLINATILHSIHGITGPRTHIYLHLPADSVRIKF